MEDYRYEIKFLLDEASMLHAINWLHSHTSACKEYPNRIVNSIYFDDPEFNAVRDNLAGMSERKKIRLRWYQSHDDDKAIQQPTLEVKLRKGRLGTKKRYKLNGFEKELPSLRSHDLFSSIQGHIGNDPTFLVDKHMTPAVHVSYDREYYAGQHNIRVTFDKSIVFHGILPELRIHENMSIPYSYQVMEIKFSPEQKQDVVESLKKLDLTPTRHSKYLAGISAFAYALY